MHILINGAALCKTRLRDVSVGVRKLIQDEDFLTVRSQQSRSQHGPRVSQYV